MSTANPSNELTSGSNKVGQYLLTPDHRSFVIQCRDKRLQEILANVFSSDLKFPSLRFTLVVAWFSFLALCFIGGVCETFQAHGISYGIKLFLLTWLGLMAAIMSPIYVLISDKTAAAVAIPFLAGTLGVFLYHLSKFLRHPQQLRFSFQGITSYFPVFRPPFHLNWEEIEFVDLLQNNTANPENWIIVFKSQGKEQLRIRNATLLTSEVRSGFIKSIEQNAPHAQLGSELITLLSPISTSSYTELWLESLTAPPKRARLAPLEPDMKLQEGRYTVSYVLASGGQGVVYCARDAFAEKDVVIKEIVLPVFGDANVRKKEIDKFITESQLLQRLDHPQIVKLFDFFIEDHRGYFVLEKIDGRSLSQIVADDGRMDEQRVRELAAQMCDILTYLHGLTPPLVHRDFTPDNLIVAADGSLKLIDFNVACELNYTTTATVVGKRSFLPPEQFRGKPTIQSDIYAWGCTLYFLVTGEEPEPITTSHPIMERPEISAELDALVARATEPSPEKRYKNVEEIKIDLKAVPEPQELLTD
ncbi:MAG TPA: serine/threonine-protein kinase [Candidatus Obscuribacterales bacterium]